MNLKLSLPIYFLTISFLLLFLQLSASGQVSCPPQMQVCVSKSPFSLAGSTPSGGTYSGPGVAGGIFTPSTAGVGSHLITYIYTDQTSQVITCTFSISVYESVPIFCLLEPNSFCISGTPMAINSCQPAIEASMMTFSGTGITDNLFYPAVAGLGPHAFSLTATDADGCTGTQTGNVFVYDGAPPTITCPANINVLNTAVAAFSITGGTSSSPEPAQTYYTGIGVVNNVFIPSVAGTGSHTITFNANVPYNGENEMCWSACTFKISVGTLPVTLTQFSALNKENKIHLEWKTTSESLFDHFEIEKSKNPKQGFTKISEIKGQGSRSSYSFVDQQAEKGIPLYYRLKMIDTDGTYAYSSMVWTLIEGTERLTVYPNPISRQVNIESPLKMSEIQLMDMSGAAVFTEALNHVNKKAVALPTLPSGVYLLRVKSTNSASVFSRLVIK